MTRRKRETSKPTDPEKKWIFFFCDVGYKTRWGGGTGSGRTDPHQGVTPKMYCLHMEFSEKEKEI
ncbi:MAG: hypothetical protein CVU53_03690 [Deltaproteobacteria bacterium HGW-Deltaproteobacteria-11]|nr:MAG: hypothetical protein CVU53_03690 [Deltaproteobacteria bacterium HGW-Deltaproteobacteria-11]